MVPSGKWWLSVDLDFRLSPGCVSLTGCAEGLHFVLRNSSCSRNKSSSVSSLCGRLTNDAIVTDWKIQHNILHSWNATKGKDYRIGMGGRHYSDRLCSDRRYSDNPQSGRPSTSLARLGLCRNSRNLEKTARIGSRRRMHRKRSIDQGTEVTEGSGVWGGYPCHRIVSYRCRETQAWKPLCPPPCITLYNNNTSL